MKHVLNRSHFIFVMFLILFAYAAVSRPAYAAISISFCESSRIVGVGIDYDEVLAQDNAKNACLAKGGSAICCKPLIEIGFNGCIAVGWSGSGYITYGIGRDFPEAKLDAGICQGCEVIASPCDYEHGYDAEEVNDEQELDKFFTLPE